MTFRRKRDKRGRYRRAAYDPTVASREMVSAGRRAAFVTRRMQIPTGYPAGGLNEEFKFIDVGPKNANINNAIHFELLNGMGMGTSASTRIGRQVILRSVQVRGAIQVTLTTGIRQQIRVMLVYDRQSNGVTAGITDVLNASDVASMKNLSNKRRFKVMMDKFILLSAADLAGEQQVLDFYRRLRHPVMFNDGNAGDISDIESGALYLIMFGEVASGATDANMYFSCRVRYTED